ncbi:probable membrane-associated kinase regulator 4 [Diospyros lotus]|uniref:probable membrane-associated kinase regulator 4 n=1 Tax=Diospyros lotus TaxID=55363 RepID=UPI00224F799B|nr:probable membrane-associated kinase regulator 4 [Diospyros lotus]
MEMEVMIPSPAGDFNFDSACTSPYISAPSSPQSFGNFFFSAPTSPTRSSFFFRDSAAASGGDLPSTIPFKWEEKPGIPKTKRDDNEENDNDFEFEFSGPLERASVSAADELFYGGKIKPLKPPPRLQFPDHDFAQSPKSPINKKALTLRESLSPRHKKKDFDPFQAAMERACQENASQERGRERTYSTSSHRKKGTRSVSPFKVFDAFFESESNDQNSSGSSKTKSSSSSSFYKKWRLKDLLLFRSASEGRPTSKESLKKYSQLKRSVEEQEEVKNSSFRSTDSSGGGSVSRRRGAAVSAHERHYTAKRAVAEEMRRKTVLPYRHGFLGCLGFNPAVHEISRGLGHLTRG